MHLLSPIEHQFIGLGFRATRNQQYTYTEPFTNITVSKNMKIVAFGDGGENPYKGSKLAIHTNPPTESELLQYHTLQTHINHCINNGETINFELRSLLMTAFAKKPVDKSLISEMDFMNLRDKFSEFIKSFQPLKAIEPYKNKKELKKITKTFTQFILDRNIYTHGQLVFNDADRTYYMQYLKGTKEAYAQINQEILNSYNQVYTQLHSFLRLVNRLLDKKSGTKDYQ